MPKNIVSKRKYKLTFNFDNAIYDFSKIMEEYFLIYFRNV